MWSTKQILLAFALAAPAANASLVTDFELFKARFEKTYESAAEELKRLRIFLQNAAEAEKMNLMADEDKIFSAMTVFADLTPEEMEQRKGLKYSEWNEKEHLLKQMPKFSDSDLAAMDIPDAWDWRDHGAVNDVKNQGQCGSCWAFGTVANLEGANVVQAGGELMSLAEQELVDCDHNGDEGCNGGLPANAYEDMINTGMGLELESDYPYHSGSDGAAGKCVAKKEDEKLFIKDWTSVSEDETQIQAALYKYGPLAIGVNAGPFQMYFGGVLDPLSCDPAGIDHAVTLVGWGVEKPFLPWGKDKPYWIIRNSWGSSWGLSGYVKVARGKGTCGLNKMVTSVLFNKADTKKVEQIVQEDSDMIVV